MIINNLVRLVCIILFSSTMISNLTAVISTRKGIINDWLKIIELETKIYTNLINEAQTKNRDRLYMENFMLSEFTIIAAHAFSPWLKKMKKNIFEEKHVDLMVCYEEDQRKDENFIGYCTFSVKGEHAYFDSCAYHEEAIDDLNFSQALQQYLLENYNDVKFMFAADLFPETQDPICMYHKNRYLRLGFVQTDHPYALSYAPDEQIKSSAQGYILNLLTT